MPDIRLPGCTPEPLMAYLKALGILRLVSEQVDSNVTGRWENDVFVLHTNLDQNNLVHFFLDEYKPTPILAPWAGGSGFFGNDNRTAINEILSSQSNRFESFKHTVNIVCKILKEENIIEKPSSDCKENLLRRYRREMPDDFIRWMDATMVIQSEGQSFSPLLGTGGNDGRLDFTQNYMQRLVEIGLINEKPPSISSMLLLALFANPSPGLNKAAVGQFSPGRVGGPNATQGMEGSSFDNPWDFVLMMEGTLFLSSALVKRMSTRGREKSSFPFTVRGRAIGDSSVSEEEISSARGEMWLPIWNRDSSLIELIYLFTEGRAERSGTPARDTLDFARAVATLGIDRGIKSFVRYGFLKRSGKAYLATSMERFPVPDKPNIQVNLFREIDSWLDRFRRNSSSDNTPTRFQTALQKIESSIFNYCKYGGQERMCKVLLALGNAERQLAIKSGPCSPISRLSIQWIDAIYDNSFEFRLACSLAGIFDRSRKIEPIRSNLEPVSENGRSWVEKGGEVVWSSSDLCTNLSAVLERRILDGSRAGCEDLPLDFVYPTSLSAISAFLDGDVDDRYINDLLWGLILINYKQSHFKFPKPKEPIEPKYPRPLPRAYALLKLLFIPCPLISAWSPEKNVQVWRMIKREERTQGIRIRPEPRILPLVKAGRIDEACRIAYHRLHVSGFTPLPGSTSAGIWRERDWEIDPNIDPKRLAASLLFPISNKGIHQLIQLITRPKEETEGVLKS